jgi:hypothetical protein
MRLQRASDPQTGPRGRYGLLLALLIATYLLSALTRGTWVSVVQLVLFVGTGYLVLYTSRLSARTIRVATVVGVIGSLAALVLALWRPSHDAVAAADIWTALLLLATVTIIVGRILSFPTVTGQSIYAAVSAYLILGFMYAALYGAMYQVQGKFFTGHQVDTTQTFQYFSFTTLTTLGYGDFTARYSPGQALAVIEALTGQIFLATLVARLVAAFRGLGGGPGALAPPGIPGTPGTPGATGGPGTPPGTSGTSGTPLSSPGATGGPGASPSSPGPAGGPGTSPGAAGGSDAPSVAPDPAHRLPASMRPGRRPHHPGGLAGRGWRRRPARPPDG